MRVTLARAVTAAEEQTWNDAALAAPVVRPRAALWTYPAPAVVLGSADRGEGIDRDALRAAGIELVRRRSGGGAVLAGPWLLGVSAVLPPDHALVRDGLVAAYRWIGEAHASALRALGIGAVAIAPPGGPPGALGIGDGTLARPVASTRARDGDIGWACFGAIAAWEVASREGRKLVGLAQVRRRNGVLVVAGTLVADPDWPLLCRVLGAPAHDAERLVERTTSCARELGRPVEPEEVASALAPRIDAALSA